MTEMVDDRKDAFHGMISILKFIFGTDIETKMDQSPMTLSSPASIDRAEAEIDVLNAKLEKAAARPVMSIEEAIQYIAERR